MRVVTVSQIILKQFRKVTDYFATAVKLSSSHRSLYQQMNGLTLKNFIDIIYQDTVMEVLAVAAV